MKNLFATLLFLGVCLSGYSQDFNTTITALGSNPFSSESIRINVEFDNDIATFVLGSTEVDENLQALLVGYAGNAIIDNVTSPDSRTIQFDAYPRIDGPVTIVIPNGTVFDAEGNTNILNWIELEYQGDAGEPYQYVAGLPGSLLILQWALAEENGTPLEDPVPQSITDMERSPNGNVFLVDIINHRIRQPDGLNPHAKYAGADTEGNDGDYLDGDRLVAMFDAPRNIAIDNDNNLFISDVANNRIRRIASNGEVTTVAGNGNAGFETGDALTTAITVGEIATDNEGAVYFADAIGNIKKLDGGQITDIVFSGTSSVSSLQIRQSGTLLIASQQGLVEYNISDESSETLITSNNVMDVIEDENGDLYCIVAGDEFQYDSFYDFGSINLFKIENGTNEISFIVNMDVLTTVSIAQLDPFFLLGLAGNNGISMANGSGNTLLLSIGTSLWSLDLTIATTDDPPIFENPIADFSVFENAGSVTISLDGVATDEDNSDELIVYEIVENTNSGLVSTDISDGELILSFTAASLGTATLTLSATSNGEVIEDDFTVTVEEAPASLYEQSGTSETTGTSQVFPDFDESFAEIADDFSVPPGETWDIRSVSVVGSTNGVFSEALFTIYEDESGTIGDQVFQSSVLPTESYDFTGINGGLNGNYRLTLTTPTALSEGDYWISVQTRQVFENGGGTWGWSLFTPTIGEQFQARDPDGLGTGYPTTFGSLGVEGSMIFQIGGAIQSEEIFNEEASICEGAEYDFGTQTLTTAGEYIETFTDQSGGDSTVVLTLTVDPIYNETADVSICSGDEYFFGTQTLSSAGEYTEVFSSIAGCDSTVVLTLSVDPIYNESAEASICDGESYVFGTQTLSTAGEFTEVFTSLAGCDSTVVLTLSIDPIYDETAEETICAGETFVFGEQTLTEAGEYTELFTSQAGCDSTVILTLSVDPVYNETAERAICQGETFEFGEQSLTEAGEYTELFTALSGCDSTVMLTLLVDPVFNETATASICQGDSYIFGTQTLSTAGEYTELFAAQNGCDSTVTLTLSIDPVFNETAEASICQGDNYLFGTQTLSTAGEYTELFTAQSGCDSTVVLTLNVDPIFNETAESTICGGESYLFGTQTLTSSGEYTEVFASELGCDSTVVLTLTVNQIFNETIDASICPGESFEFGEQTLNSAGSYIETFTSQLGCDSTVMLNLSIDPISNETAEESICPGDTYSFGSQTLDTAGEYVELFTSQSGCDSTVTLTLTIDPIFNETADATICSGETFEFGSQTLSAAGEYVELFSSQSGCDSTVTLTLSVTDFEFDVTLEDQTLTATDIADATYQWITCDGDLIDGETGNVFQATSSGEYMVIVTSQLCDKTSECFTVELPLAVGERDFDPVAYPNPSQGIVNIDFKSPFIGKYEIYDLAGKSVGQGDINDDRITISMEGSPNGMYHLYLRDKNGQSQRLTILKVK